MQRRSQLVAAGEIQALVQVVGRQGPVVRELLTEEVIEFCTVSWSQDSASDSASLAESSRLPQGQSQ